VADWIHVNATDRPKIRPDQASVGPRGHARVLPTVRRSRVDPTIDELLEGTPYRPLERLGIGGMGVVYAVEHSLMLRRFALKVTHHHLAGRRDVEERFRLEAQALARTAHPNVVEVFDFWSGAYGRWFVVMELLTGKTLASELRGRGRLPYAEAVEIALQTLAALSAAHALGVVHRDIKPENLFLQDGFRRRRSVKVLDFGLVRLLPEHAGSLSLPTIHTKTGTVVGSPRYLSPEGLRGERVGPASDLYSLALVLHQMLTGRGPFDAGETAVLPLSTYVEDVFPAALDDVMRRALSPAPSERHESADAFAHELRAACDEARVWNVPPRRP
jgi:serine/threonine protein kinase